MVGKPWRRVRVPIRVPVAAVAVMAGVAGLAGCHSGGASGHPSGSGATSSAGSAVQTGSLSVVRLRGALLAKINGVAAAPAQEGSYASLAAVKAASQQARGGSVTPTKCARMTLLGLDSAALAGVPAVAVTFRVGPDGVSEVLASMADPVALRALAVTVPAECGRYQAAVGGTRAHYTAMEATFKGIGTQARVVNVQQVGKPAENTWSIAYRGKGFVGAVTITGPDASQVAARELAQQAYAWAAYTLR